MHCKQMTLVCKNSSSQKRQTLGISIFIQMRINFYTHTLLFKWLIKGRVHSLS